MNRFAVPFLQESVRIPVQMPIVRSMCYRVAVSVARKRARLCTLALHMNERMADEEARRSRVTDPCVRMLCLVHITSTMHVSQRNTWIQGMYIIHVCNVQRRTMYNIGN